MIEVKKLHKKFPLTDTSLLNDINVTFELGVSYAITGPSGSGKSTFLQLLGAIDNPSGGEIAYKNLPYTEWDLNQLRCNYFGFVFQSFFLFEDLSCIENVLMPARIARKKTSVGSEAYKKAVDLTDRVGLKSKIHQPAYQLSGGEKQRISIARALINDPQVIFADEPTGNIDMDNSKTIENLLIEACLSENKTLIVVTHDLSFAKRLNKQYKIENKDLVSL